MDDGLTDQRKKIHKEMDMQMEKQRMEKLRPFEDEVKPIKIKFEQQKVSEESPKRHWRTTCEENEKSATRKSQRWKSSLTVSVTQQIQKC